MKLNTVEGYSSSAEAQAFKAQVSIRAAGAKIDTLSVNASFDRSGPKVDAPANNA